MEDCDAVIAHFSKTTEEDLLGRDLSQRLPHHLGYMGVREIFRNIQADLCIIAEWSGDQGDIRYEVAELIKLELEKSRKTVIPADVGLLVTIPDKEIRCSVCQKWVGRQAISVGRPAKLYGPILYYCSFCLGKEAD